MKLLKPSWMSNNDKPIFSIDIHPDNSRCATAVQGAAMGIGEIIIWNMGPIRDEKLEKDLSSPSVLCRMENHNACVNCVRWSPDGRYLASASDDKLVIVWHCLRNCDEGSVFGNKNLEAWKVASTLRGHSGDVLDLSWSATLQWLASCSVDNTIIIWNVANLPEQIATLKRHTSMVKGVSFDPTATYLASQSDDQSVRVWRTYDWKEIKCITEPFTNSSGNSHLLRLDWSPDGDSLVATNAVNNTFPVAQIIERTDWNTRLDMVGHRKPTTCVRYNSRLFTPANGKKRKHSVGARGQHAICGLGSKDRSLSIWSTFLGRPVVVIHDLFKSSILDISWAHSGMEMMCCSWDGTVAYASFSEEEIGIPISQEDKEALLEDLYGKTALNYRGKSRRKPIICESVEQLSMLEGEDEYEGLSEKQRHKRIARELQAQHSKDVMALYEKKHPGCVPEEVRMKQEGMVVKQPARTSQALEAVGGVDGMSQDVSNSSKSPSKQIETRTRDGRRKIMPIFLAHQPNIGREAPLPFTTSSEPLFSSSKEASTIVVEKQNSSGQQQATTEQPQQLHSNCEPSTPSADQAHPDAAAILTTKTASSTTTAVIPPTTSGTIPTTTVNIPPTFSTKSAAPVSLRDDLQTFLDRKRDVKGSLKNTPPTNNHSTNNISASNNNNRLEPINFDIIPQQAQDTISASVPSIAQASRMFSIPALKSIRGSRTLLVSKSHSEGSLFIECCNSLSQGSRSQSVNRMKGVRNGETLWQSLLSLPVVAFTANSQFIAAITSDHTLHTFKTSSGRSTHPPIQMDSPPSLLKINSSYVMLVNARGHLFVWDLVRPACLIRNESLEPLFSVKSENLRIFQAMITDQGIPIISLSNGRSYSYNMDFQNWVLVSSVADLTTLLSDFSTATSDHSSVFQASVLHNISKRKRGLEHSWETMACDSNVQCLATLAHLESKVNASIALKLPEDFHLWTMNYVRYLIKFDLELRLRDVLQELINPFLRGVESPQDVEILGVNKEQLFRNILQAIRKNQNLQSLYKEFESQLESISQI